MKVPIPTWIFKTFAKTPHCTAFPTDFFSFLFGVLLFALLRSIWIGISFLLIEGFPCTFWFQIVDLGEFWISYISCSWEKCFMGISLSSRLVQRTKRRYNRVVERKVRCSLSITICYSNIWRFFCCADINLTNCTHKPVDMNFWCRFEMFN